MKKLAIGCAVVVGLVVLVGAVSSYLVLRKVGNAVAGFSELRALPALDRSVRDQTPYVPPASGDVRQPQLQRFLQVQQTVRSRLGTRFGEFEKRYRELLAKDSAGVTDVPELISAYRDLAGIYVDAKRAQVAALNESGFSLEEYRWVRRQAYGALGVPIVELDVTRIVEDIQSGRTPAQPVVDMPLEPSGSADTRKLVEQHRKVLESNAALAAFGL